MHEHDENDYNTEDVTLSARNLCRRYGRTLIVQDIDLQLRRGEIVGLLGVNGTGKSTTLRMLTGNLAPSSGNIEICGYDLLTQPQQAKMHLGFLPEIPPLYGDMTVDAYLLFVARIHRLDQTEVLDALEQVKHRCGLVEHGKYWIKTLSKGYQQRLGIAQAIIHNPDVIILDEPTVGLDPNQMREIRLLIRELGKDRSVVLSTHILPDVEMTCERVLIMHQGRIVWDRQLTELRRQSIDLESVFMQLTQPQSH
ncbi:MAG: ABC transporter ATP-binding protein [Nitrosomonas sp.]|nr:MAG: ABC transporter ATP-binding protein [Nitrosomonas sp.]